MRTCDRLYDHEKSIAYFFDASAREEQEKVFYEKISQKYFMSCEYFSCIKKTVPAVPFCESHFFVSFAAGVFFAELMRAMLRISLWSIRVTPAHDIPPKT